MEPVLLIHGYSAEGRDSDDPDQLRLNIRDIYGGLVDRLRSLGLDVVEIDLSRWLSLDDGLSIEDIAQGLDNALRSPAYEHLLDSGFNVVIHSTGALVTRAWLRRYWDSSKPCPIKRIVHLAGANFGSAVAVVGQSLLAKWFRHFQAGTGVGQKVLQALELGASWTIDMQLEVDRKIAAAGDKGPLEFLAIGSQPSLIFLLAPIPEIKEDGSDDTVRVPAGNLNYIYVTIQKAAGDVDGAAGVRTINDVSDLDSDSNGHYDWSVEVPAPKPFAIVKSTSHVGAPTLSLPPVNDETAIMNGANNEAQMLRLLKTAFSTDRAGMAGAIDSFAAELKLSRDEVDQENQQGMVLLHRYSMPNFFDTHAMIVFRIWDQNRNPVSDFSIYFNANSGGEPAGPFSDLVEDTHKNRVTPNCLTYFLRLNTWDGNQRVDLLSRVNGFTIHVDAEESLTQNAKYVPVEIEVAPERVSQFIQADKTTIIDVYLTRTVGPKAFQIVTD